jgi:hypothetical protein
VDDGTALEGAGEFGSGGYPAINFGFWNNSIYIIRFLGDGAHV